MRSVLTSRVEEVERTDSGVVLYRLTNGLVWAGADSAEMPEVFAGMYARATLLYEAGTFFLHVEGMEEFAPVRLVACRRKVWDEGLWRSMLELAVS